MGWRWNALIFLGVTGCADAADANGTDGGARVEVNTATLAAGHHHTCRLDDKGAAWCWGRNEHGQLGVPVGEPIPTPVPVGGGRRFVQLTAGSSHTCGRTSDAEIWCWGRGGHGQLGHGERPNAQPEPVLVAGLLAWSHVTAGSDHTCATTTDGEAWCWGTGNDGRLGATPEFGISTRPIQVSGGLRFRELAAGYRHTCGVDVNGKTWCWGSGATGAAGSSGATWQTTPNEIHGFAFERLATGSDLSCALDGRQQALCWGRGALGRAAARDEQPLPLPVDGGRSWAQLAAGHDHACGRTPGGKAYCWGSNGSGAVGTGTESIEVPSPAAVEGGLVVEGLAAGFSHTCALDIDGQTWCWGRNADGQLGVGDTEDRPTPTLVP